jgi:hypothetical protein
MTWVILNLVSIRVEIVFVSVQGRCIVCAKRTIGSELILDTPVIVLQGDGAPV